MLNNNKVLIYCEQQVYDISHLYSVYDQVLNWTH